MLQCAPMSAVPVLQPAPMLLQLTRTGGQIVILGVVIFHCTT